MTSLPSSVVLGSGVIAALLLGHGTSSWTEAQHARRFHVQAAAVVTTIQQRLDDYQNHLQNARLPRGIVPWQYPEPDYGTLPYATREYWRNLPALLSPLRGDLGMQIDVYEPLQPKRVTRSQPLLHFEAGDPAPNLASTDYEYLVDDATPVHIKLASPPLGAKAWFGQLATLAVLLLTIAFERSQRNARQQMLDSQRSLERSAQQHATVEMGAAIVHELNQPLTGLLAALEALSLRDSPSEPAGTVSTSAVQFALDCARRAVDTMVEIRAQIQRGDTDDSIQLVSIADVVRRVVDLTATDPTFRDIDIIFKIAESMPPVRGRSVGLAAALLNLLRNSAEAMVVGGGLGRTINIETAFDDHTVTIIVNDDGPGFADPQRLFHAFYSTKPQGLGLGLRFCKRTIERYGGTVTAVNADRGGACVTIVLLTGASIG